MRSWIVASLLLGVSAACRSTAAVEREQLMNVLGQDPVELLRTIGGACDASRAAELARDLDGEWSGADELRLLRFGLAHDDERVVFGATVLMGEQLPVPELRHAASVVIPRLADADCPVTWDQARQLIGSVDFAAVAAVVPKMPEQEASWFLGHLHRMVRPDAIPVLCELARSTEGAVRRQAFADAVLTAEYSDQHVPLLVATWLDFVGRQRDAEPAGPGLPGVLAAALRAHLERPELPPPPEGELDRRLPGLPVVPCARWLVASTPGAADVMLLRQLLASPEEPLRHASAWALGAVDSEAARAVLQGEPPADDRPVCWTAARARAGDPAALERLLAGDDDALAFGLALASQERRRAFCARLLTLPFEQAQPIVSTLGEWSRGEIYLSFADPPYDDRYLGDLEPLVAASSRVDARLLRLLIRSVPACQTGRLADVALALPVDDLFTPSLSEWGQDFDTGLPLMGRGDVWAFLEVTRPEAFSRRLREGLDSTVEAVRDRCAGFLIRLGDPERLDRLAAWIDARDDAEDEWVHLARDVGADVVQVLRSRLLTEQDPRRQVGLMRGLAVALGMPFEFAMGSWNLGEDQIEDVRAALLAGDAAAAFLRSQPAFQPWSSGLLANWQVPAVRSFLREQRDARDVHAQDAYLFDQLSALATDDHATLDRMLQAVRDGRYATHDGFSPRVAAHAKGLAMLPFWIDDLGSNCCKCVFVEEVLQNLFVRAGDAYGRSRYLEPTGPWLRRTLLPVADRLRWSRIANGYVVAGR